MRFNSKGQAFDVFKLLIAAVIALAMLAILMPILQNLIFNQYGKPGEEAANQIKNFYNRPSDYGQSKEVTFNQQSPTLNAEAIASAAQVGLDQSQICMSLGEFKDSTDFGFSASTRNLILKYTGSQKKVKLGIMCDDGANLEQSLADQGLTDLDLKCIDSGGPSGNQTFCAIVLIAS